MEKCFLFKFEFYIRKYFHRASHDQQKESYEMIVCHANIIRFKFEFFCVGKHRRQISNSLRYFVCRAIQVPPEAWLRITLRYFFRILAKFPNLSPHNKTFPKNNLNLKNLKIRHASVTWIVIRPDGRVAIRCIGDAGHMPMELVTSRNANQ